MSGESLVSVVIPCYKCEDTIERAVLSVINQNYDNWELILVEDCSNDKNKTRKKLESLKNKYEQYSIQLHFQEKNGGPSVARNKGIHLADGEYIALLDADDSWHPNKLSVQVNMMKKNKEYILCCHKAEVFSGKERYIDFERINFNEIQFKSMLFSNKISTRTVMLRKDVIHRFNENMRYAEDFRLWMEIMSSRGKVLYIDEILAYSYKEDFGENGLSARLWEMEKGELSTFKYLKNKKIIGTSLYRIISVWSLIKYVRRVVLVKSKIM